jgi:arylformamidase
VSIIIDLTIPMQDGLIESCPGEPRGHFMPFATIADHGWASHQLLLYTHGGTHLDAPCHFIAGARDVASLPLEAMMGPALVADVQVDEDSTFSLNDIRWPRPPHAGERVLLRTGWERRRGTPEYFTRSPHLGLDVAQYVVDQDIALLGLDLPTPNRHAAHEVHQILLGAGILLIEALINLTAIEESEGLLTCLALPLVGLDGSPVRVVWTANPSEPST